MSAPNGHASETNRSAPATAPATAFLPTQFTPEEIKKLVAELEVPFDPSLVEWRVTNTTNNGTRGQVMPYADPRAYSDRLNKLFSPAGWTRGYEVQTSAVVQRDKNRGAAAKVLVTCELTILGIGSKSGTGEEWSDNDNALTAADAQSFKRACSCFGLGRYLYDIPGEWVDLDQHKRPKKKPRLPVWATPEGWAKGLRPNAGENSQPASTGRNGHAGNSPGTPERVYGSDRNLTERIEQMQNKIGNRMYRGLLKRVAHVWTARQIDDLATQEQVLAQMESAARGFARLQAACTRFKPDTLRIFYRTLNAPTPTAIEDLETLKRVVLALEKEAGSVAPTN
jgi:hypothetical protein